eukprot:TRINITY_DN12088_c0_g1_i1.p1 TRINITY_DN12088_c0_g1~~TRINITY_DN12088_c0_g1_i1.p1  ORF type:complete len:830 (+),score=200.36 TRINITY_DN12088_c0_g1_i1:3-2492(+)
MTSWGDRLFSAGFTAVLHKRTRWALLSVWFALLCASVPAAMKFLSSTSFRFIAPDGTQAATARHALYGKFPQQANLEQVVFLVTSTDGKPLITTSEDDDNFVQQQEQRLMVFTDFINQTVHEKEFVRDIQGLYLLPDSARQMFGQQFVSEDHQNSIIVVSYKVTDQTIDFAKIFRGMIADFEEKHEAGGLSIEITGIAPMFDDINDGIVGDMVVMDATAVPLALVIFWWFLRSFKLLLLPGIAMISSILLSFGAMLFISEYVMQVGNMAPALMTSVVVALSTDYSLFLLTRFKEELGKGNQTFQFAVGNMLYFSGQVVGISGVTLLLTFCAMLTYPTFALQSVGVGVSFSILSSILINLLIVPSIMLTFPNFFDVSNNAESTSSIQNEDESSDPVLPLKPSLWRRWGQFWSPKLRALCLIIVTSSVLIACSSFWGKMETTTSGDMLFPSNAASVKTLQRLRTHFDAGLIAPFTIQAISTDGNIFSEKYFSESNKLIETMKSTGLISDGCTVLSLSYLPVIGAVSYDQWQQISGLGDQSPVAMQFMKLKDKLLSPDSASALTQIAVDFDPQSYQAEGWIASVRRLLQDLDSEDFKYYLSGGSIEQIDVVVSIQDRFKFTIIATFVVVLVLIGLIFKSFILPVRGLATILLSISSTFGITVLYFQYLKNEPLFWIIPIMNFSILTGLGLDYDIFLVTRIYEYRMSGCSTKDAIINGLDSTGSIITGAGLIMAVAFTGLMFSHVRMLNQSGMILLITVLLDTFVVRTALVPALMQLLGEWNWFPSKFTHKSTNANDSFKSPESHRVIGDVIARVCGDYVPLTSEEDLDIVDA